MAKYQPPEGYIYDWGMSSYYCKVNEYSETTGQPVLAFYLFDPLKGTTQKYTYPIDPVSGQPVLGEAKLPKEGSPFVQSLKRYPTHMTKIAMLAAAGGSLILCILVLGLLALLGAY